MTRIHKTRYLLAGRQRKAANNLEKITHTTPSAKILKSQLAAQFTVSNHNRADFCEFPRKRRNHNTTPPGTPFLNSQLAVVFTISNHDKADF